MTHHGLESRVLLKKGAEASLYLEQWQGRRVLVKRRLTKAYRVPELDRRIRTHRTICESHLLHLAKQAGVPTPTIFMVDTVNSNIVMEFIKGNQVKQILNSLCCEDRKMLSRKIGELVGLLHSNCIIHGDLTTSNMIQTPNEKIVFVDFGLGEKSNELESRGIDLHLMKRALQSTHFEYADSCFQTVIEGYSAVIGEKIASNVLEKIAEIEKRGRYISDRGKR
ncbi:MAG: Kae1-associated kinase Bud32 [Candidatus Bathyarchaeota archaeon]|nr:Kae1-associated kinase Bud32 [Candidatus Bathyarchaeota archaeon]